MLKFRVSPKIFSKPREYESVYPSAILMSTQIPILSNKASSSCMTVRWTVTMTHYSDLFHLKSTHPSAIDLLPFHHSPHTPLPAMPFVLPVGPGPAPAHLCCACNKQTIRYPFYATRTPATIVVASPKHFQFATFPPLSMRIACWAPALAPENEP